MVLIELTIPCNSPENLHAVVCKSSKENYQQLLSDIEETNRKASLVTIEIGSLGHSLPPASAQVPQENSAKHLHEFRHLQTF